jgi:hypothetical protein
MGTIWKNRNDTEKLWWHCRTTFSMHMAESIDGTLCDFSLSIFQSTEARAWLEGQAWWLRELAAQGSTQISSLHITGLPAPDRRGVYRPHRVTIETPAGALAESRDQPRSAFQDRTQDTWNELDLVYFCGISIWNCPAAPFLLAMPGTRNREIDPWQERGETWQRLTALFLAGAGTMAHEQTFYFDRDGLQRRTDYAALDQRNTMTAQYSWAHQQFSGIVVPTPHRGLILSPDGSVVRRPPRVDVEIFDVRFE